MDCTLVHTIVYSMSIKVTAAHKEIRGCSARVGLLVTDSLNYLGD